MVLLKFKQLFIQCALIAHPRMVIPLLPFMDIQQHSYLLFLPVLMSETV
jgi:hypothetical protein